LPHREAALQIVTETAREEKRRRILEDSRQQLRFTTDYGRRSKDWKCPGALHESKPHSRAEVLHQWLDDVVQPGRIVGIGRSGRRLC